MSEYTNLYKNTNKKSIDNDNLDKSWSDMWANTSMVKNSNILSYMFPIKEGATAKQNTQPSFFGKKNTPQNAGSSIKAAIAAMNKKASAPVSVTPRAAAVSAASSFPNSDCQDSTCYINQLQKQVNDEYNKITDLSKNLILAQDQAITAQDQATSYLSANNILTELNNDLNTSLSNANGKIANDLITNNFLTASNKTKDDTISTLSRDLTTASGEIIKLNSEIEYFDYQLSYNLINKQNIALESTIQNINALYSTDDRKTDYQSAQTETLNTASYVLLFIYFALLIVVAFILVYNLPTMNIYIRGAIMVGFTAYPFVIGYIEMALYIAMMYIYSILNGNVYTNGKW